MSTIKKTVDELLKASEISSTNLNEKILKECNTLYTDPKKGLLKIGEEFGFIMSAPRKKITVLLMGNHSAGKSSFINWYIEEYVQKTSVAIETQGFTLVTSGKKRESLMGNATLHLYPYLKPLQKITGVIDFLTTELSPSKQKKFNLITFIDTPGLVDGDTHYPFDVKEGILWLGAMADLIFVFFDPIGQALCKKTLTIVEELNIKYVDKIRFYLSKSDDFKSDADRQKVMMQIVQELCKRPGLNRTGFDMPTIYIPNLSRDTKCLNQLDMVCSDIDNAIEKTVQSALDTMQNDCKCILDEIKKRLDIDNENNKHNFTRYQYRLFAILCIGIISLVALYYYGIIAIGYDEKPTALNDYIEKISIMFTEEDSSMFEPKKFISVTIGLVILINMVFNGKDLKPTLSNKEKKRYREIQKQINTNILPKKESLYLEYLQQYVGDHD